MSERSRPLDGIRGLAILAVMANHTGVVAAQGGYLGVDVFFVLSGYLITTLLLREREQTGRLSFGRFYMRRALRLYPALLITCAVAVVFVHHVGFAGRGQAVRGAVTSAAYLQDVVLMWHWWDVGFGLFHTWSLSIEEQFYLVWPAALALVLAGRWRKWSMLVGLLAVGVVVSVAALIVSFGDVGYEAYRPYTRGGALLVGCLLAVVLHRRPVMLPPWLGWVSVAVLVATLVLAPSVGRFSAVTVAMPATWLATAVLLADLVTNDRGPARLAAWRPLAYVGLISYSLYLYHPLINAWVSRDFGLPRRSGAPVAIVLSLAAAALSYHVVELRFLRLKSRFRSGPAASVQHRLILPGRGST